MWKLAMLMTPFAFFFFYFILHRNRNRNHRPSVTIHSVDIKQYDAVDQVVAQLVTQYYVKKTQIKQDANQLLKKLKWDEKTKQEQCVICLESFKDNEHVVAMSCDHIYHRKCIVEWFHTSYMCPLCRRNDWFNNGTRFHQGFLEHSSWMF